MLKPSRFPLIVAFAACLATAAGCASMKQNNAAPDSLASLENLAATNNSTKMGLGSNEIRQQALQETAMSIGAQAGLAARAQQINATLSNQQRQLDEIFNFNRMLMAHNVLPPVLTEGRNILNLADSTSIRLADRTYEIVSQARFVTAAPNWRDYLWLNYTAPEQPDLSLLPKNRPEKAIWKRYINEGWQQGFTQANTIYAENLARLKRDFAGMILYRKLLAQNIVSAPFVASSNLGVTSDDSNSTLRVHDQVLRITALPTLQANSKLWKARINQ